MRETLLRNSPSHGSTSHTYVGLWAGDVCNKVSGGRPASPPEDNGVRSEEICLGVTRPISAACVLVTVFWRRYCGHVIRPLILRSSYPAAVVVVFLSRRSCCRHLIPPQLLWPFYPAAIEDIISPRRIGWILPQLSWPSYSAAIIGVILWSPHLAAPLRSIQA